MTRKSRNYTTIDIDIEIIRNLYNMPIEEAAKKLGVCVTILKRICRRKGIPRWPYRKLRSLNKMISSIEEYSIENGSVPSKLESLKLMRNEILYGNSLSNIRESRVLYSSFNSKNENNILLTQPSIISTPVYIPRSYKFVSSPYENRNNLFDSPLLNKLTSQNVNSITYKQGDCNNTILNSTKKTSISKISETICYPNLFDSSPNILGLQVPTIITKNSMNSNFILSSNMNNITNSTKMQIPIMSTKYPPNNQSTTVLPPFSDLLKKIGI